MRLLHTADWHLGNTMHNVDRRQEQEEFLLWLTQIVKDEKIDTLIVAGDIFDTYGPPNWAQKNYYRFLASLLETDCHNVIVIGGNHDSGNLLDAPRDLFDALNIHVVGTIANKNIEDMVFELKDENDNVIAVCAAVPYVPEILLDDYCDDRKKCPTGGFSDEVYSKLYRKFLDKALELKNDRNIPLIATGHLYAAGLEGRYEGMEEEKRTDDGVRQLDVVGNLGKVHVSAFPEEFDYVALGHIHYQTRVNKCEKIRYSGSPFVMGFDETDVPHCVLCVDLDEEGNTHSIKVKQISVPHRIYFRRLSGTLDEIKDKMNAVIKEATDTKEYKYCLELYYEANDAADLRTHIEDTDLPENVSVASWKVKESDNGYQVDLGVHDIRSMSSIKPEDIVRQLVLSHVKIDNENMTEEEYKKKQQEEVDKYLPYFLEAFDTALNNGGQDENT
ncbi:MAG: exonuclease subunit SbcD [Lachnospiraceae bacterium]|nr:exonuclease subunit SbcD [Lachnospiraceae bacterium]